MRDLDKFNFLKEKFGDIHENYARDTLKLNIKNWAKFRYAINIGTPDHRSSVVCKQIKKSQVIWDAWEDLGKSHYQYITNLVYTNHCFQAYNETDLIYAFRNFYDLYYHAVNCIDALSRIIFILYQPNSIYAKNRKGIYKRKEVGLRHIKNTSYFKSRFQLLVDRFKITEIQTIRNNLSHGWRPTVIYVQGRKRGLGVDARIRYEKHVDWMDRKEQYNKRLLSEWLSDDYRNVEQFGKEVFEKCIQQIPIWEKQNDFKIYDDMMI